MDKRGGVRVKKSGGGTGGGFGLDDDANAKRGWKICDGLDG